MRSTNLLGVLLLSLAILPAAGADHFDSSCDVEQGNVPSGYEGIDILRIASRVVDDAVEVRVTMAGDPGSLTATHSLTVDFEGNDDPDLSYLDNGGGSLKGSPVYWSSYPQAEGNDVVYVLKTSDGEAASAMDGPKWTVNAGAFSYSGSDSVADRASCSAGGGGVPAPAAALALAAVGAAAALLRRR